MRDLRCHLGGIPAGAQPYRLRNRAYDNRRSLDALPDITDFESGRDISACLRRVPKPYSTGGKERLGRISLMRKGYLRWRLYPGTIAQLSARRLSEAGEDWLWKII